MTDITKAGPFRMGDSHANRLRRDAAGGARCVRAAKHPYPDNLVIVTKLGAVHGVDRSWLPAQSRADLTRAVHDNLRNLGLDVLDIANLRVMGAVHAPSEGSIEEQFSTLAELQRRGLVRHLGLSSVTP